MITNQGAERMLVCDACHKGVIYANARTDSAIRRNARDGRWSTARGRDLCRECSAAHNATAASSGH